MYSIFHKTFIPGLFLFITILNSCSSDNNSKQDLNKWVIQTLDNSRSGIRVSTQNILFKLKKKKNDFTTAERAAIWLPKMQKAMDMSNAICASIIILRNKLPEGSDKKADRIARVLLQRKQGGHLLLTKMRYYRRNILAIDPRMNEDFYKTLLPEYADDKESGLDSCLTNNTITCSEIIMLLAKLETDARMVENKIAAYCDNQVMESEGNFSSYAVIIGQSTNVTLPGKKVEIVAGVGAFSSLAQPAVSVGNILVPIDESGTASYSFIAPGRAGNYSIPVRISFIDPATGRNEKVVKNVEYTVIAPCDTLP